MVLRTAGRGRGWEEGWAVRRMGQRSPKRLVFLLTHHVPQDWELEMMATIPILMMMMMMMMTANIYIQ